MIAALLLAAAAVSTPSPALPGNAPVLARHETRRPDGTAITYWLDAAQDESRPADAILVMQGTGCEPVSARPNLQRSARLLRPGARILLIDKQGVEPGPDNPVIDGCPRVYWDHYTLSSRVQDCLRVIADLRRQPWWTGRLVLFGGSEGGAVAALLAPLVPETKAVVVLSSGTGVPEELIRAAVPPEMAAQAPAIFAAAHDRPTGAGRWGGLSYRWWDDAVDILPARSLAQTPAPVLLIHGARDQSSPVATARAGYALLREGGKANADYREFPQYDHFMRDAAGGEHMDAVLADAARWIAAHAGSD